MWYCHHINISTKFTLTKNNFDLLSNLRIYDIPCVLSTESWYTVMGKNLKKVENEENHFFAITSSKLVINWFCKKHLLRNHICHNYWFFMFFSYRWFWRKFDFCVFCSKPQKISQKISIFNIRIVVPNIIWW